MHGVRTRKSRASSSSDEAAGQKPAARRKRRAGPAGESPTPAPEASAPPFLLAPPTGPAAARGSGFPRDITVPPHRGALIVAAPSAPADALPDDYLIAPAPPAKPRQRAKPAGKGAAAPRVAQPKQGQPKQGRAKQDPAKRGKAKAAKPKTGPVVTTAPPRPAPTLSVPTLSPPTLSAAAATTQPVAGPPTTTAPTTIAPTAIPVAPVPLAAIPLAAIPLAERLDHRPPRRDRALVRQGEGFVARMVAWLGRLMPRQRRAALPRARTRLARQDHAAAALAPAITAAPPAAAGPMTPPAADAGPELNRRMLLELSQENDRLRREVAALRATLGETARP